MTYKRNKKSLQKQKLNNMNSQLKADQRIQNLNDLELPDEKILKINNLTLTCLIKREQNKAKSNIEAMAIFTQLVFREISMLRLILTLKKT